MDENKIVDVKKEEAKASDTEKTKSDKKELSKLKGEVKKLTSELEKKTTELEEANDKYLRMIAEYDNYRKRTQKEHDSIYATAYAEALGEILPMADNLERALAYAGSDNFAEGIQKIVNQFADTLARLGIEAFGKRGDPFDPEIHNAVMKTEDETLGESTVAEVLQKGYKKGDRILRHAMVKVAN